MSNYKFEASISNNSPSSIYGEGAPPRGSKLAQYLHGTPRNFTRPPPRIHNSPSSAVGEGAAEQTTASLSQMKLAEEGSDEDRVDAFLNGTRGYFSKHIGGGADEPTHFNGSGSEALESSPAYYTYQGLPSHVWKSRIKSQQPISPFFVDPTLKAELVARQLSLQHPSPSTAPDGQFSVPPAAEQFHNLVPMNSGYETTLNNGHGPSIRLANGVQQQHLPGELVYRAVKATDGLMYLLRRVPAQRPLTQKQLLSCENWKRLSHTNIVQMREVIQTRAFNDNSFLFVYNFHPLAETLKSHHFGRGAKDNYTLLPKHSAGPTCSGLSENVLWNYIIQLAAAIRQIHSCGLVVRLLDLSRVLICGKSKILIGSAGLADVVMGDGRNVVSQQPENMATSMQYIDRQCSLDLKNTIHLLFGAKSANGHKPPSINEIMPMIGARFFGQIENLQMRSDFLEDELAKEIENGRLFRLLCKLNTVNERPNVNMDPMWGETGDRYLLKLFRDYVFHQVSESGKPWIDLSHITSCLNKMDSGIEENVQLVSRDGENLLIVSYSELRKCLETSFQLLQSAQFKAAPAPESPASSSTVAPGADSPLKPPS